jgi:hypothetical protein
MSKKSRDLAQQREADRHSAGTARSAERVPAITDGHSHALYDHDDDELDTEPAPESRPTIEELVGMSEPQIRSTTDDDADGDVITGVVEEDDAITVEMDPIAAMIGEEILSEASFDNAPIRQAQRPGTPRDSLSIEPDELGAHFLKAAVQDPGPLDQLLANENENENEGPSAGEKRMLEELHASREGALVTELPDGTSSTPKKRPRARKSAVRRVPGPPRTKKAV